jgi:hypothetical protein
MPSSLKLESLKDCQDVSELLRNDEIHKQRILNDQHNRTLSKIAVLHKALYDHGTVSDSAQNLGMGGANGTVFNGDQVEMLAERYTLMLLNFCQTDPAVPSTTA